jgi:4-hydroxybenzoate polyprenyltransferase
MAFKHYLKLLRPQQWYKNLLIFLPLIFVGQAFQARLVWVTALGFIALSLVSSFNYIINDIVDRTKDRAHPEKRSRPIASGKVPIWAALIVAFVLLLLGMRLAYVLDTKFMLIALALVISTQAYSFLLKKFAFADILTIGLNFVLRAMAGTFIIHVMISPWLILCTFFFALFLATGKRHADVLLLGKKAQQHKEALAFYTKDVTNALLLMTTVLLIASYCLYAVLGPHRALGMSIPFALFAIFRYFTHIYSGSPIARHPEKVITDWQMVTGMALWALTAFIALYIIK